MTIDDANRFYCIITLYSTVTIHRAGRGFPFNFITTPFIQHCCYITRSPISLILTYDKKETSQVKDVARFSNMVR